MDIDDGGASELDAGTGAGGDAGAWPTSTGAWSAADPGAWPTSAGTRSSSTSAGSSSAGSSSTAAGVWSAASDEPCAYSRDDMLRAMREGPPLALLVGAAYRAAGVADDPVSGWSRRSRWSALVPAITSRIGNSESWRDVVEPTVSHAVGYDVRVSWRLERLIYDPNEPRFTAFDMARRRERRRIAALVSRAYFGWLHARAAAVTGDAVAGEPSARALIQAQHAHADLDALTDGWFSQALAKGPGSR